MALWHGLIALLGFSNNINVYNLLLHTTRKNSLVLTDGKDSLIETLNHLRWQLNGR